MIEKTVKLRNLHDRSYIKEELDYWLSPSPYERIEAVEFLRRQAYGDLPKMRKIVNIRKLPDK